MKLMRFKVVIVLDVMALLVLLSDVVICLFHMQHEDFGCPGLAQLNGRKININRWESNNDG